MREARIVLSLASALPSIWRMRSLVTPKLSPISAERALALLQKPAGDHLLFARRQVFHRLAQPGRAGGEVVPFADDILGRRAVVGEKVLHLVAVIARDAGIQRPVGVGEMRLHALDGDRRHAELARDPPAFLVRHGRPRVIGELGAKPPQVEEQAFLRRRGADPDDRGVANHVFLDGREDPPRRIGREPHLTLDVETVGRLKQPDIALLDEIADRQAVTAELGGDSHHQADMRRYQLAKRALVPALAPTSRKIGLVLALQNRRVHDGRDIAPVAAVGIRCRSLCHHALPENSPLPAIGQAGHILSSRYCSGSIRVNQQHYRVDTICGWFWPGKKFSCPRGGRTAVRVLSNPECRSAPA